MNKEHQHSEFLIEIKEKCEFITLNLQQSNSINLHICGLLF